MESAERLLRSDPADQFLDSKATSHPLTSLTYASPEDSALKRLVIRSVEQISGQPRLQKMYWDLLTRVDAGDASFFDGALQRLGVDLVFDQGVLDRVPHGGPLVVIANHPYGVLDGLAICGLVSRLRPRFKVLAHAALCREPRLAEYFLPVDFDDTPEATRTNISTKRRALVALRNSEALIIFPSGGVATSPRGLGTAIDLEWKLFAAKLVQQAQAPVLPMFFHGQNSRLFQLVSQLSLTLRLAMLMHEVRNKMGEPLRVTIGETIPFDAIAGIQERKRLTEYLRAHVESLGASVQNLDEHVMCSRAGN